MALSGSLSNAYGGYTYKIEWSATQNISNNTSTITCVHKLVCGSTWNLNIASRTNSCTVDGVTQSYTSSAINTSGGTTITLGTTTHTVTHNSDGTKSCSISGSFNMRATIGSTYVSSISASSTITLNTIARKSDFTVGTGTLGVVQTITVSRQSTSFTHTLTWVSGSYSGTICTKSTSESLSFTPSLDLANGAPYGTSVYIEFKMETFNGSTSIGSVTKSSSLAIPASVKPSCSISVSDATGYASTYGGYIQGKSKLSISISATTAYSSPIKSYSVTADGNTFTTQTVTTPVINGSGTLAINATVKDGRSRTGTASSSVTVLEYSSPKIPYVAVNRCNEDGTENISGSYAKIRYSYDITSLSNNNTKNITLSYKKASETEYTVVNLDASSYSSSESSTIITAAEDSSYDILLTVTDAFGYTSRKTSLSTAYCLMHMTASGKGITFGGIAEKDGFNVLMDAHFGNGVTQDIKVLADADCDEMLVSGTYYLGIYATNRPENANGWLSVKSYGDANYCYQTYITYTGIRYYRMREDGTWKDWIKYALDAYPVGSIYISYSHTSPETLFGGTWERISNRFLWGCDSTGTIGATGGESEVTLTINQIPSHSHNQQVLAANSSGSITGNCDYDSYSVGNAVAQGITTGASGGGGAHNNMPPYIQVSIWRRTA